MLVALQLEGEAIVPLKLTVLVPWVGPKFAPTIVTDAPTPLELGERLVMLGGGTTVKVTPLLACPPTVTTTLPVTAPLGTEATMLVTLQLDGAAIVPLKLTVFVPCVVPKFAPAMVTDAPNAPDAGDKFAIEGTWTTVKVMPLLGCPPTVTNTLPVVAPGGTGAMMLVALQLEGEAIAPLKVIVLAPCVAPKFAPAIVTEVPTAADAGDKLVMLGGGTTAKVTPLLVWLMVAASNAAAVPPHEFTPGCCD
jgi:hypothetical protein